MSAAAVNLAKLEEVGVNITRLESDSRAIRQGDTFCCLSRRASGRAQFHRSGDRARCECGDMGRA